MLIIVEGRDGVGKTTFAKSTVTMLADAGIPVTFVREPVDRACITAEEPVKAFAVDRLKQAAEVIMPALARGEVVVSDRSLFSSLAYQNVNNIEEVETEILKENAEMVQFIRRMAASDALKIVLLDPPETLRPADENVDANDANTELQQKLRLRFIQVLAHSPPEIRRCVEYVGSSAIYLDRQMRLRFWITTKRHLSTLVQPAAHG